MTRTISASSFFDSTHILHQQAETHEEQARQIGEMISRGEKAHYLEISDWERWGEFLGWVECRNKDPKTDQWVRHWTAETCLDFAFDDWGGWDREAFEKLEWPPPNIVLLGRASTEDEWIEVNEHLVAMGQGWSHAVLLVTSEKISDLWGVDETVPPEQIIVNWYWSGLIPSREQSSWHDSIIDQVKAERGKCLACPQPFFEGQDLMSCLYCNGTGINPGPPWLWVEGSEEWEERA